MKKVLIFGINGYLGGLSATALHCKGWQIHGIGTTKKVDRNLSKIVHNYVQIKSRISKTNLIISKYSLIIFCISLDHNKSEIDYRHTININCGILADIMQVLKLKSPSTKILYLSTMQVYKDQNYDCNITDPGNIYGYTHLACEQLLKLYNNATILRLSNVYGPPQTKRANIGWTLIADLCKSVAKYNTMEIRNDGTAVRNFLFSEDYQDILINLISSSDHGYMTYDVIGINTSSVGNIKRILESIASINGKKIFIKVPENYIISSEKKLANIKSTLEKNAQKNILIGNTELFEGLKRTVKYYEEV